jgi:peptide/nickel transport system substrate-binding protein
VLEPVETVNWFPKIYCKDCTIAINGTESGVDDPDQQFDENLVCGAVRNYTGYCNPQVDKLIDEQSAEADPAKRKKLVWEIERPVGRGRRGGRSSSIRAAAPARSPMSRG